MSRVSAIAVLAPLPGCCAMQYANSAGAALCSRSIHQPLSGGPQIPLLSIFDFAALAFFVGAWAGYAFMVERTRHGRENLNARVDHYRETWMRRMLARDMRMVDMQIMAAIQNGTAFFASTSLIAIGGALTLLRATEEIISVVTP